MNKLIKDNSNNTIFIVPFLNKKKLFLSNHKK